MAIYFFIGSLLYPHPFIPVIWIFRGVAIRKSQIVTISSDTTINPSFLYPNMNTVIQPSFIFQLLIIFWACLRVCIQPLNTCLAWCLALQTCRLEWQKRIIRDLLLNSPYHFRRFEALLLIFLWCLLPCHSLDSTCSLALPSGFSDGKQTEWRRRCREIKNARVNGERVQRKRGKLEKWENAEKMKSESESVRDAKGVLRFLLFHSSTFGAHAQCSSIPLH